MSPFGIIKTVFIQYKIATIFKLFEDRFSSLSFRFLEGLLRVQAYIQFVNHTNDQEKQGEYVEKHVEHTTLANYIVPLKLSH